jgi:integrase
MEKDLKGLFEEFIREQEFVKCLRPETLRGYRHIFEAFIRIMPTIVTAEDITTTALVEFYKRLKTRVRIVGKNTERTGVKQSTVLTYRQKLRLFFEWLRIKGYLAVNPFNGVPFPKVVYEDRRFLKQDEIKRIYTAIRSYTKTNLLAQKRNILMFLVLLYCGLRFSELKNLEIRDVDLNRKILTVRAETSKSAKTRQIPLHSDIIFTTRII